MRRRRTQRQAARRARWWWRAGSVWLALSVMVAAPAAIAQTEQLEPGAILAELAQRFDWQNLESEACIVQIDLTGEGAGSWHLVPHDGGGVVLRPGPHPDMGFACELDQATLEALYRGEMSGMTAAGKDLTGGASPLEIRPGTRIAEDTLRKELGPVFHFLTHFFAAGDPLRLPLGREHARSLNGASMVGLFYHPGFRSAWYSIRSGETLGGQGDTTPYPQSFVVMSGRGRMRIGARWVDVDPGEAIYVPPGTMHAVESRGGDELQVLWMAWGDGA